MTLLGCMQARTFHPAARAAAGLLTVWLVLVGAYEFGRSGLPRYGFYFRGPHWRREAARWREHHDHPLAIWPRPWVVVLKRR